MDTIQIFLLVLFHTLLLSPVFQTHVFEGENGILGIGYQTI